MTDLPTGFTSVADYIAEVRKDPLRAAAIDAARPQVRMEILHMLYGQLDEKDAEIERHKGAVDGLRRRLRQMVGAHSDSAQYWQSAAQQALRWVDTHYERKP